MQPAAQVHSAQHVETTQLGTTTPLGWSVRPSLERVEPRPGVVLWVRAGDTATVLRWAATRWARYVEPLLGPQCGGYNPRVNVNRREVWSEHAAGTAIDLNWLEHPNGHAPSADLRRRVHAAIHPRLRPLCRWGGDFSHPDPMHLELLHRPDELAVLAHLVRTT